MAHPAVARERRHRDKRIVRARLAAALVELRRVKRENADLAAELTALADLAERRRQALTALPPVPKVRDPGPGGFLLDAYDKVAANPAWDKWQAAVSEWAAAVAEDDATPPPDAQKPG